MRIFLIGGLSPQFNPPREESHLCYEGNDYVIPTQGVPKYDMVKPSLFRKLELRARHSSRNRLPKGGLLVLRWGSLRDVEKEEEGLDWFSIRTALTPHGLYLSVSTWP
jgi:hypothetical protein